MPTTAIPFLLIAALAVSPAPAADTSAAPILERHVRWRGGPAALASLRDVRFTGVLRANRLEGAITLECATEGRLRLEYDLQALARLEVVGPAGGFVVNPSGQVEPLTPFDVARQRFAARRALGDHLRGGAGIDVRLLPSEEKDGRRWDVLRFVEAGVEYDLFVDPKDGSAQWSRETEDTETIWSRLEDWREVRGLKFPHVEKILRSREADNGEIVWKSVQVNAGVAAERFDRPAPRARLARLEGGIASTGWMPMTLLQGRHIFLAARVNGHETEVLLDSGAGGTVIDAALAKRLGLEARGEITTEGIGGAQSAGLVQDLQIDIGPLRLAGLQGVILDLSSISGQSGRSLPVILGKEVFHEMVVDVDYPESRIAFHDPGAFEYRGPGTTVPLIPGPDGHRLLEARVEGKPGRFTLDTGSGGTVDVFAAFSEAHRLLDGRAPISETQGGGVGGAIVSKIATLRSFDFAGFELKEVPATFPTSKTGAFHTVESAGNLGAGIFGRFRLVLDYSRERLHVEPGAGWDTKPFRRNRLGIAGRFEDGAWTLTFVAPSSPAARAGWKVGDRFASVDGRPLGPAEWPAAITPLMFLPVGTEVVFVGSDGQERRLVTADYY